MRLDGFAAVGGGGGLGRRSGWGALSSISSGRSCGTAGISGEITEFAIRAGLKYLVGVSRDVARRTEGGRGMDGWSAAPPRISLYTSSEFRELGMFVQFD